MNARSHQQSGAPLLDPTSTVARDDPTTRETLQAMTMPNWWTERRFGLLINATAATVPAWAPIGESADWYRSHIGDVDADDAAPHQRPLVEALAHHRDRWGHVASYDDFAPLLDFDLFDAEDWASLARNAGAGYAIHTAKHHDGWAWWDAPGSARRLTDIGPMRNIVAEFAAACERNDIVFATSYSLLEWGAPTDDAYVGNAVHPQVLDLVERFGTQYLWGCGHRTHDAGVWRTAELFDAVRSIAPDIVINDGWRASAADVPDDAPDIVTTFEHTPPNDITPGPWELVRDVGLGSGYNRNERAEHHLTGVEIVDLLTEVCAKGGNLVIGVGPMADGTIPDIQAAPLRDAGTWIRRHGATLANSVPWQTWGDRNTRYLDDGDSIIAIDISGRGRFDALSSSAWTVSDVTVLGSSADPVEWHQDDDGVHVTHTSTREVGEFDPIDIAVFRIALDSDRAGQPEELFAPVAAAPIALAPLLADARPGDIIRLGDATYLGPAEIPAGVTVRGLGPDRTIIGLADSDAPSIIPTPATLTLAASARVEHLSVRSTPAGPGRVARPVVDVAHASGSILGCSVDGIIVVSGDDVLIRAATCIGLTAVDANRLHVSRCHLAGNGWDVGIQITGGTQQHVESNNVTGHLCAVKTADTTGITVRGNSLSARWQGVHLDHCDDAHVRGNRIEHTMRAVDIDGGAHCVVDGNAVTGGDSGCVVQDGAASCEVYGNHWEQCRIGLLDWGSAELLHSDNVCTGLHEEGSAILLGP